MEHLDKLAKVLRYAGLNLTPQIVSLLIDPNIVELVQTLDVHLKENETVSLDDIDEIVNTIDQAAKKQAEAEALKQAAKNPSKKKLEKA